MVICIHSAAAIERTFFSVSDKEEFSFFGKVSLAIGSNGLSLFSFVIIFFVEASNPRTNDKNNRKRQKRESKHPVCIISQVLMEIALLLGSD